MCDQCFDHLRGLIGQHREKPPPVGAIALSDEFNTLLRQAFCYYSCQPSPFGDGGLQGRIVEACHVLCLKSPKQGLQQWQGGLLPNIFQLGKATNTCYNEIVKAEPDLRAKGLQQTVKAWCQTCLECKRSQHCPKALIGAANWPSRLQFLHASSHRSIFDAGDAPTLGTL